MFAAGALAPHAAAAPPTRVLVTTTGQARLPPDAHEVARIAGLRFATLPVPARSGAAGYGVQLARRDDVVAAQADTPLAPTAIAGNCIDRPTAPMLGVADTVNARSRRPPSTTRPIAVLDTGVDPAVPELAGRVLPDSNATGRPLPAAADDDGHGTQVAAMAAAAAGLFLGVSPTSPVMPIRVATASLLATPSTIVKGLELAVSRRARVAVLPYSQPLADVSSANVNAVGVAVSAAFSEGVIVVAPAGNEGLGDAMFPGSLPHLLTVGSAGASGVRDEFSNTGPWIDLAAPGAGLALPAPPSICLSGYASASGTSFSAGAVAGAVAWLGAARPSLSTAALSDLARRRAARDQGSKGFDTTTGFGMLDVGNGIGASASDDPREVDDDVYWLKRRKSSIYLRRARTATLRGSVSPGKDPQDAFRVYVRRGELLRARVRNLDTSAVLYASIWSRGTRDFDMRLPVPDSELRATGFTQSPNVSYRATRTGTHYVAVFAPSWTVPGEQGEIGKDLAPLSIPRTPYRITLSRRR